MVKEKRILSYILGWFIVGFIIIFIGVNNVFADEKLPLGYLSDKSNIQVVVPYNGAPLTLDQFGEYYLDDVDELLIFVDNYEFIGGKIYELELYLPNATLTNANIFTVSGVTSDNKTVSCDAMEILQENKKYVHYKWRCNKDVNSLTFNIKNSNDENIVSAGIFRWDYTYLLEVTSTTDNSEIIDGLGKVEQSIIDSNKETQEVIKDQFNSCRDSYNLLPNIPDITRDVLGVTVKSINNEISVTGTATGSGGRLNAIMYFTLSAGNYKLVLTNNINSNLFLSLSVNGTAITSSNGNDVIFSLSDESQLVLGVNVLQGQTYNDVFKVMIVKSNENPTEYEPYGEEICSNKIDETNDKLDNLTGAITDSSSPDTSGLTDSAGWLPAGPLDSVLNLPLSLFNALTTNLNKSCSPINIPLPYVNKNITLPCINTLYQQIGITSFLSWIGVIVSGLMLYTYLLKLYKWIEDRISLNETHNVDSWGGL